MARDQWELGVAPAVVDDRKIGMADPAVIDGDFDLLVTKWTRIKFEGFQGGSGSCRGVGSDLAHPCLLPARPGFGETGQRINMQSP